MPRAFGTDRLAQTEDGLTLTCERSKGWLARRARTQVSADHPGTAVRWEDEFWEVTRAEPLEGEAVRYTLAPWDELHVFRVVEDYGEASEAAREAVRHAAAAAHARRHLSLLLAPLAGHLPAHVQTSMELEFNAPAVRLTVLSAAPLFLFGGFCVVWFIIQMFGSMYVAESDDASMLHVFSTPVLLLGQYLFVESAIRLGVATLQGRPIGSVLGTLSYAVWEAAHARPGVGKAAELPEVGPSAEEADYGAYHLREPLLAFLSPEEQRALEGRFGFEPLRWGRITAWVLLLITVPAMLRCCNALKGGERSLGDVVWFLVSIGVAGEQVKRLLTLARGLPAGSVLGHLVRPFTRSIL